MEEVRACFFVPLDSSNNVPADSQAVICQVKACTQVRLLTSGRRQLGYRGNVISFLPMEEARPPPVPPADGGRMLLSPRHRLPSSTVVLEAIYDPTDRTTVHW